MSTSTNSASISMTNHNLYIPMEIINRELDGHILLALAAKEQGWSVHISTKRILFSRFDILPPGVFLLKSIVPGEIHIQTQIRKYGHKIACLDQEGLLQRPGLEYRLRFDEDTIALCDKIFFWGPQQLSSFNKLFPSTTPSKLVLSGSPRADYWQFKSRSIQNTPTSILNPPPPGYIFFATSFGDSNHVLGKYGQSNLVSQVSASYNLDNKVKTQIINNAKLRQQISSLVQPSYVTLLEKLADRYPQTLIVVRPHPSESLLLWKQIASSKSNILIRVDGSPTDWILNSKLMIQYGSTLAIEASVLGKPTLSLLPSLPYNLRELHLDLPSKLSFTYITINSLVDSVHLFLSDTPPSVRSHNDLLNQVIYSYPDCDSSSLIIKHLNLLTSDLPICSPRHRRAPIIKIHLLRALLKRKLAVLLSSIPLINNLIPHRLRHLKNQHIYGLRKTPTISCQQFKERIANTCNMTPYSPEYKLESPTPNYFILSPVLNTTLADTSDNG